MAWHMPCHVIYDVMFYVMSMSCQIMSYTMSYHAIFHVVVGCGVLGFTRQYREKEQGSSGSFVIIVKTDLRVNVGQFRIKD